MSILDNVNDRFLCSRGVTITLDKQEWSKLRDIDDAIRRISRTIVTKL